ncbi:MAG: hypothetical protein QOI28_2884 [Mycobacterium sp.]|jgi:hypothetical protein|nr:hypothetical protein [Mycobacterium sp.]
MIDSPRQRALPDGFNVFAGAPSQAAYRQFLGILPLVCPTDFDRHVVAVVPRVVSAIEKVAEIRVADRDRAQ